MAGNIAGCRVLVVEDEILIALDFEKLLGDAGCEVIGPFSTVGAAFEAIRAPIDVALLDINLDGELVFALADALAKSGVPFVLITGHALEIIPPRHSDRPLITKPYSAVDVLTALASVVRGGQPSAPEGELRRSVCVEQLESAAASEARNESSQQ